MCSTLVHRAKPNKKLNSTHRVTTIRYRGYDSPRTQGSADRARMALDMIGVNVVGPIPFPRRRRLINILKSPFKWKKHQELWERRTYTRLISFEADVSTTRRILDYLYRTKYEGVGLRVRRLSFEPLEKYWKNPYLHYVEVNRSERVKLLRASKTKKKPTLKVLKPPMKAKIWHLSEHHVMREMTQKKT